MSLTIIAITALIEVILYLRHKHNEETDSESHQPRVMQHVLAAR